MPEAPAVINTRCAIIISCLRLLRDRGGGYGLLLASIHEA
jgi:hypothetical protein